jgi:pyruvate,water dikinase
VHHAHDLDEVEEGEIVVAELLSHSWAPVFTRISAAVTECGGMMCHTVIVCREYGLPAVTGVTGASRQIVTGQLLRVDGNAGTVTVIG